MRIEIPETNLRGIPIFPEEPGDELIEEIKQHVQRTSSPHTWRGHSHTRPPKDALVVYIEEFDVPASDKILRVAPCPCCNPYHPQYKNKGKIAWFPQEAVIRLIGPQCFAAINAGGHDAAIIDLRRRQKRRNEISTIRIYSRIINDIIRVINESIPIAEDIDAFMHEINRVIENELQLQMWREVKDGNLTTSATQRVTFQKANGASGERIEEFRAPFARISGHTMIDRSGKASANKLKRVLSSLAIHADRLRQVTDPESLTDVDRERIADELPKGRAAVMELLAGTAERQRFLTSNAVEVLKQWGQHRNAPIRFGIERKKSEVLLSMLNSPRCHAIPIGKNALKAIPEVPELEREQ